MNKPRLINANELLKRMCNENCYHECRDNMDRCVWWHYINDSPTAYDTQGVVEQLKECSVNYCKEYGYAEDENVLYLPDAIEIVKGGAE